jgi:CTP synthase (UTP-ammonia lyase)
MPRIAVVGDYTPEFESHPATTEAVQLAGRSLGLETTVEWIPTTEVTEDRLHGFAGVWAAPGSPYKSFTGMLSAIRSARERLWPFVGT